MIRLKSVSSASSVRTLYVGVLLQYSSLLHRLRNDSSLARSAVVSWSFTITSRTLRLLTRSISKQGITSVARRLRHYTTDVVRTTDCVPATRLIHEECRKSARSYALLARRPTQHYSSPLVPSRILFYFCCNFFKFSFRELSYDRLSIECMAWRI